MRAGLFELVTSPNSSLSRGLFLLPRASGRFGNQPLLDSAGRAPDIAHLAIHERFDSLQIRKETALGNGGDVRADTAALLGFATAPNDAAFHRAFACQFT